MWVWSQVQLWSGMTTSDPSPIPWHTVPVEGCERYFQESNDLKNQPISKMGPRELNDPDLSVGIRQLNYSLEGSFLVAGAVVESVPRNVGCIVHVFARVHARLDGDNRIDISRTFPSFLFFLRFIVLEIFLSLLKMTLPGLS